MAPKSMVKVQSINLYCILQKVINTIEKDQIIKKKTSTVYNMISIYTDTCTFEPTYWYMYCTVCMQIPVNLQNTVVYKFKTFMFFFFVSMSAFDLISQQILYIATSPLFYITIPVHQTKNKTHIQSKKKKNIINSAIRRCIVPLVEQI